MFKTAILTPRDLLAPPGEPLTLEVEVERRIAPFLDPAVRGAEVEIEGVGRAVTDAAGEARLSSGPLPAGDHRFRVRLLGPWKAPDTEMFVRVAPREAPLFITDIDGTIADVTAFGFIVKPMTFVRPLPGAAEAIREIAERMALLYLTARDHIFLPKTKAWLRRNGFPDGPVYARRATRFWTVRALQHKLARLAELRPRFTRVVAGVGDLPGDLEAYARHGIPPVLISPRMLANVPDGTLHFRDWESISRRVLDTTAAQS